jgi:hypothetical protein
MKPKDFRAFRNATDDELVAFQNDKKPQKPNGCGVVAVQNPQNGSENDDGDPKERSRA